MRKHVKVSECYEVLSGKVVWSLEFRCLLSKSELVEHVGLVFVLNNYFICKDDEDLRVWIGDPFAGFEVKFLVGSLSSLLKSFNLCFGLAGFSPF